MIYFKVEEILEKCKSIDKILIPSDNETRVIAGTCFINNVEYLKALNEYLANHSYNQAEMEVIMRFQKLSNMVDTMPVIPPEYKHKLQPQEGIPIVDENRFKKYTTLFDGVWDPASLGQWVAGIDVLHNPGNTEQFVNPHSSYRIDRMWLKWEKYEGLFRLKISGDKEKWYNVYNLHIHKKYLKRWLSDNENIDCNLPNVL
jgi:hypothetical protein